MSVIDLLGVLENGSVPPAGQDPFVATEQTVSLVQGADHNIRLTIRITDGSLFDLTGSTLVLAVNAEPIDASQNRPALLSLAGVIQGAAVDGRMDVAVIPTHTLVLSPLKPLRYDIFLTDSDDKRWRVVKLSTLLLSGAACLPGAPLTP